MQMELKIDKSYNANIFTPYGQGERDYCLLFRRNGLSGPFFVSDSAFDTSGMMLDIGSIKDEKAKEVGYIFYSKSPSKVEGTFFLAYSGNFKEAINSGRTKIKEFGMELVLKSDSFYLYNKANVATLVVNPVLSRIIRSNFEV